MERVLGLVQRQAGSGPVRLLVDGAPAEEAHRLAGAVVAGHGRAVHVRAEEFWRPAGQRFEHGREDPDAWLDLWLDEAALQREVLERAVREGAVVTGLRDPERDRSLRRPPVPVGVDGLVVVSGSALLGRGWSTDVSVHLQVSVAALRRRMAVDEHWLLPALVRYAEERAPASAADLVVRVEDPRHPAVVLAG